MLPLNAIDAIGPAFTRTHQILFKPFRVGRSWKLAVTQYLGLMGAIFAPVPLFFLFLPARARGSMPTGFFAGLGIVLTLILLGLFYVGVRLQFVNFEMVITKEQFVAPMWRRYGARVWPVVGVKMLIGTVLTLLCVPVGLHTFRSFRAMMLAMPAQNSGQAPDPQVFGNLFAMILGFYAFFILIFLVFKFISTLFQDLVLPFFTLEDISIVSAMGRGFETFLADPVQWILFFVMKAVLSFVGFVMQYVSNLFVIVPFALLAILALGIGGGLSSTVQGRHGAVGAIAVAGLLYVCGIVVMVWYQLGSYGYLMMLLESYAIYFLGGRYPRLGDLLEPPSTPAYVYAPPPVFPSEEERRDDDSQGPTLPMNPALA